MIKNKKSQIGAGLTWFFSLIIIILILLIYVFFSLFIIDNFELEIEEQNSVESFQIQKAFTFLNYPLHDGKRMKDLIKMIYAGENIEIYQTELSSFQDIFESKNKICLVLPFSPNNNLYFGDYNSCQKLKGGKSGLEILNFDYFIDGELVNIKFYAVD